MSDRYTRRQLLERAASLSAASSALALEACIGPPLAPDSGITDVRRPAPQTREYWIKAESYDAEAAPIRQDLLSGRPLVGKTQYAGLRYRAYTAGWRKPLPESDDLGSNTGVPGPIIRAAVGEVIIVHFRNEDRHYGMPHSVHPHGVFYDLDNDGSWTAVRPGLEGAAVPVGDEHTYVWTARVDSVGTWVYHDHSIPFGMRGNEVIRADAHQGMVNDVATFRRSGAREEVERVSQMMVPNGLATSLGLLGFIVVTGAHTRRADREFFVAMHEIHRFDVPSLWEDPLSPPDVNAQLMCINGGSSLANTPIFRARVGELVRWHIMFIGTRFRGFRIDGRRWWDGFRHTDRAFLNSAQTRVLEYVESQPGSWLYGDYIRGNYLHSVGRYEVSGAAT